MQQKPDARPLYAQVRDIISTRIRQGQYVPAQVLPSEMQLATELGVSQGTVRKALDELTDGTLLERKQGVGTFVVEHTEGHVLFKFFKLFNLEGQPISPEIGSSVHKFRAAKVSERSRLSLAADDKVIDIARLRLVDGAPALWEQIVLPAKRFPKLEAETTIPNTLYDLFQSRYGLFVTRVVEDVESIAAPPKIADKLDVDEGTPLLKIDRIAYDMAERPIEWRITYCSTATMRYRAELV